MARVCHTNNCPVGVASQREELRARFPGAPADLVNFFHFVAEEVRDAEASVDFLGFTHCQGAGLIPLSTSPHALQH
jgi:glutamate synthase (ferredoxin)